MVETHKPSCARAIRHAGLADGWSEQQIVQAIHEHCAVGLLRAHRLARGWTLEDVVAELCSIYIAAGGSAPPLSHQRVSQWEKGADTPCPKYLDALCRVYRTRPDRLGFGRDYGEQSMQASTEREESESGIAIPAGDSGVSSLNSQWVSTAVRDVEGAQRIAGGGFYGRWTTSDQDCASDQLLNALQAVRMRTDMLLETQSVSAGTVDRWESRTREYGYRQLVTPHYIFLLDAVRDFDELHGILSQRQPLEFQQRLYRVMAQLASLIGFTVMGAGALRESRAWHHTARLAADETGDRILRAFVMAYEGWSYLWDPPLMEHGVSLFQAARTIAGAGPTAAGALAASLQARAYARLGCRRDAHAAMQHAEAMYERLDPTQTAGTRFGFYERRLRYDQENCLAWLGETQTAIGVQEHALGLPNIDSVESVMIQLDHANCMIVQDELAEGCRLAREALLNVPQGFRISIVTLRAQEISQTVGSRGNGSKPIQDFREVIAAQSKGLAMEKQHIGSFRPRLDL